MKKMWRFAVLAVLFVAMACTKQSCAFNCGGDFEMKDFPCGRKLVNITWKQDDLWMLTRPLKDDDVLETYTFSESSSMGVMEGQVTIKECR